MPDDDLDVGPTVRGFKSGQRLFDRYLLERVLGRGGMGIVWLARDAKLERAVALKFMPDLVRLDAAAIDDLKRETRRSLELTHPNIVRIHDFVDDAQTAAIAMEYVDGATVSALRVGKSSRVFETAELENWMRHLVDALDYAHTRVKIVHRDLKPANLMVNGQGEMKMTDFGISRSISDSVSRVSQRQGISGTLSYMSPQQAAGSPVTVSDDIYSLGATFYELLTSKPPFHTGNLYYQIESVAPPRIAQRRRELGITAGEVPEVWEEVIGACLAKDPSDRPGSVDEITERLGLRPRTRPAPTNVLPPPVTWSGTSAQPPPPPPTQPVPPPPPVQPGRPWGKLAAAGAAVILLAVGVVCAGVFFFSRYYKDKPGLTVPTEKAIAQVTAMPGRDDSVSRPDSLRRQQEQSEAQQFIEGVIENPNRLEEARVRLRRYLEAYGADAFYNASYQKIDRAAADQRSQTRQQEQARAQQALETMASNPARAEETRVALRNYLETFGRDAFYDSMYARLDRLTQSQTPPASFTVPLQTPSPSTPYRPPPPPSDAAISAQDAGNLIVDNLNALQKQDLRTFVSAYADRVSWFDDGSVDHSYIYRDKVAYFKIWDTLRMTMTDKIRIYDTERPDVKRAEFTYHYVAANSRTGKTSQGDSHNIWTLQRINGSLLIISTKERVPNRRLSR
jgi:serine/threonine protein kinase